MCVCMLQLISARLFSNENLTVYLIGFETSLYCISTLNYNTSAILFAAVDVTFNNESKSPVGTYLKAVSIVALMLAAAEIMAALKIQSESLFI